MKKLKVLAIMLASVLCFSVGAFVVGCDNDKPGPGPGPGPIGGDIDVPVVDGKVTFYFTLAGLDGIPEYGAVFYAGGLTGWTEAGAPAFTQLNDTSVYYVQLEVDNTLNQWDEYSLTLGYSAASGLPADKLGVQWSLKSDECNAIPFPDNMKFEMADGATTVNLGTHTFSTALSAPETVDKVTLKVTFAEPLAETDEVYLMGGFNGWNWANAKTTANESYTTYSLELTDILCTNYDYKIVILAAGDNVVTEDEEGNALTGWDQYYKDSSLVVTEPVEGGTYMARTEISAGGSNLPVSIIKRDNNSYVDLAGTVSKAVPEDGIAIKGLDLSKAEWTEGKTIDDAGEEIGNGKFTHILSVAGIKTFTVTFTEALPEDILVFAPGGFNGWDGTGVNSAMTISDDRLSATLTIAQLPGDFGFKLVFIQKDAFENTIWGVGVEYGVAKEDGSVGDAKVTVTGYDDGDVALFDEAIEVPDLTPAN